MDTLEVFHKNSGLRVSYFGRVQEARHSRLAAVAIGFYTISIDSEQERTGEFRKKTLSFVMTKEPRDEDRHNCHGDILENES